MKKPSVTELCDILAKPALISWANKIGLQGKTIKSYKKESTSKGIKKHANIENYLLNGVCLEDELEMLKINNLFNGVKILAIEESFENDLFHGRCDIRFEKDGYNYICDFKSKFTKPYLEHYIQLVSYKMHFGCDRIGIINLSDYQLYELSLHNEDKITEIIYNLVSIYNIKQTII